MAFQTLSNFYNPLQSAAQAEQIKAIRQQQEMNKLKIMQQQAQAAKSKQFNQYQQGQQQPAQQVNNPIQLQKGQAEAQAIAKSLERSIANKDYDSINKLGTMAEKSQNVQAFMLKASPDLKVKVWSDPKAQEAHINYSGEFSREALDKMADSTPGAGFLKGLPPGKYELDYDPINKSFRPSAIPSEKEIADKNLTRDEIIAGAAAGDPEMIKARDAILDFKRRETKIKFGELNNQTIDFYADKVMANPSYISKFSARSPQRAEIAKRVVEKATEKELPVPQIELQNKQFQGAVSSYNKQRKAFDATVKTSDEFLNDADRVLAMIGKIRTNNPAWANKSLVQLKKLAGTTGVGEEEVILNELFSLSSAFMRTASDTAESISELSAGMQKIQNDMNSPYSPLKAIETRIKNQKVQVVDKVGSRRNSLTNLEKQMKKFATFEKKKKKTGLKSDDPLGLR